MKMKRAKKARITKALALLLTLCMPAGTASLLALPAFAAEADGLTRKELEAAERSGGTVSIDTQADFETFAAYAVTGASNLSGVTVELNTDVSGTSWTPIPQFNGTFDGNGHTVGGYAVSGAGFFASLGGNAIVRDVTLDGLRITATGVKTGAVAGQTLAGSLVTLSGIKVTNLTLNATDAGSAGGLVGYLDGTATVKNCLVDGSVTGASTKSGGNLSLGGVVGAMKNSRITSTASYADVTIDKSMKNGEAGGIVGRIESVGATPTLSGCANYGSVYAVGGVYLIDGVQQNSNIHAGGLCGNASVPVSFSDCLSAGDVSAQTKAAGLVAFYTQKTGSFVNCLVTGRVHSIQDEYSNGAFIAQFKSDNTDPNRYILLQSCYYLTGLSSSGNNKVNNNAAMTQYNPFGSTQGNIRVVYPAKGVDFTFVGGTHNTGEGTYAEHQDVYNAMFTDSANANYTGACLATEDVLWGTEGMEFLSAAGYSFGDVWLPTSRLPDPSGSVKDGGAAQDTSLDIVYKGYQVSKVEAGTVRLIAGLGENLDYANTGFDLQVITADGTLQNREPLRTTVVYESLTANGVIGTIKASDLGCRYLSAITLTNLPEASGVIVTPYLTQKEEGGKLCGTPILLAVKDGAVTSQYVMREELASLPYTLLGTQITQYKLVLADGASVVEQKLAAELQRVIAADTGYTPEIKTLSEQSVLNQKGSNGIMVGDVWDNDFYNSTYGALDYSFQSDSSQNLYVGFGSAAALNEAIEVFRTLYGKETESTLRIRKTAEDRWGIERAEETDIRVMTSNTLVIQWDTTTGMDGGDRMQMLAETYNLFMPDFVGLQEHNAPSRELSEPHLNSAFKFVEFSDLSTGETYFPVLYRSDLWQVEECGSGVEYGDIHHPWGFVYVRFSRVDNPDKQVLFYNLHYTGAPDKYPGFRTEVADELNRKIKEMSALYPNAPVIVTGDYNSQRAGDVFGVMYDGLTLETSFALTQDTNLTATSRCIDHISVSADKAEVLRHRCLDYFTMSYTSDHRPYFADLRIIPLAPMVGEESEAQNEFDEFKPYQ